MSAQQPTRFHLRPILQQSLVTALDNQVSRTLELDEHQELAHRIAQARLDRERELRDLREDLEQSRAVARRLRERMALVVSSERGLQARCDRLEGQLRMRQAQA